MWLGSPQQLAKVNVLEVPLASTRINVSETARDLGVVIDSQLSLSAHVAAVCRSDNYGKVGLTAAQTAEAVKTLVQAFISCHRDYCNSLFYVRRHRKSDEPTAFCPECGCTSGVGRSTVRPHHTSAMELHWLPVRSRVDLRMTTLVYLSLSGMAPAVQPI